MAFERLRAHGAVVGTVAVIVVAGVSVASLAVAQGRLKEFDRDARPDLGSAATVVTVPPSTSPAPAPTPAESPSPASTESPTTTTTAPVQQSPPTGILTELFSLMNADRAARGLAPLAWDNRLAVTAQRVSDTMADSQVVAPKDLNAILALGYTRGGETVVTTPYATTAVSIEYGWMGSSSSRATILDAALQHVGVGATSSPDGRIWFTVDFGGVA